MIEHTPTLRAPRRRERRPGRERAAEALLGWERDALIGLRVLDVIVPEGPATHAIPRQDGRDRAGEEGIAGRRARTARSATATAIDIPVELTVGATETHARPALQRLRARHHRALERDRERREETGRCTALAEVTSRLAGGPGRRRRCATSSATPPATSPARTPRCCSWPTRRARCWPPAATDRGCGDAAHRDRAPLAGAGVLQLRHAGVRLRRAAEGWPLAREAPRALGRHAAGDARRTLLGVLGRLWDEARSRSATARAACSACSRTRPRRRSRAPRCSRAWPQQSRTDALTGVAQPPRAGRRAAPARCSTRAATAVRFRSRLDLDTSRPTTTLRPPGGDGLLKGACAAWSDALRAGDVLARFGGEEFVDRPPGLRARDADVLIDRLRARRPAARPAAAGVAGLGRQRGRGRADRARRPGALPSQG